MRPVVLIAVNFAREQRWPAVFLLLWVVGWAVFGIVADGGGAPEDILMLFKQLVAYSVAFAVFFGSSAIQADQRSHRILTVLSKALSRRQYLAGLLAGVAMVLGVFCLCLGFSAMWLLGPYGITQTAIWDGMVALFTACLMTSTLTLLLSTFLPPLFAAIGSGLIAGLPLVSNSTPTLAFPVYALLKPMLEAVPGKFSQVSPGVVILGWMEVVLMLLFASWIFARRDLAVATE